MSRPNIGQVYRDWEPAAKASKKGLAISARCGRIHLPRGSCVVQFVKPLSGDPYAVYASANGVKVHDWKPSNADVDRVRLWKAW